MKPLAVAYEVSGLWADSYQFIASRVTTASPGKHLYLLPSDHW
jgi:hypothetical protein